MLLAACCLPLVACCLPLVACCLRFDILYAGNPATRAPETDSITSDASVVVVAAAAGADASAGASAGASEIHPIIID